MKIYQLKKEFHFNYLIKFEKKIWRQNPTVIYKNINKAL